MPKFISFFGSLGAGKTTRAKLLAGFLGIPFYSEKADSPFLTDMFLERKGAFLNQLHFLYRDRNEILECLKDIKQQVVIFDYYIAQVEIFSSCFLEKEEYEEFQEHYNNVIKQLPLPDLVVYLKIDVDLNLSRIRERGRAYEKVDTRLIKKMRDKTIEHVETLRKKTNVIEIDANYDVVGSLNSRLNILTKMLSSI